MVESKTDAYQNQDNTSVVDTIRLVPHTPKPHDHMLERLRQTLDEFNTTLKEEELESARVTQEFESRLIGMQQQIESLTHQLQESASALEVKQSEIENHLKTIRVYADLAANAQEITAKAATRIEWYRSQMKRLLDMPPSRGAI